MAAAIVDPNTAIARTMKSTVMIIHSDGQQIEFGSGFCANNSSTIITNRHVVVDDDDPNAPVNCVVCCFAGTPEQKLIKVPADNIHLAPESDGNKVNDDLAVIKIDPNIVQPLTIGNSDTLSYAQRLHAVGFPDGPDVLTPSPNTLPTPSVLDEVVQRLQSDASKTISIIQLGGSMTHGDSGGPIIDESGNVMGVCQSVQNDGSIGYAVPAVFVDRLIKADASLTGAPTPVLTPNPESADASSPEAAANSQDETQWSTYTDDTNGFALEYPTGWTVTQDPRPSDYAFVRIAPPGSGHNTSVVIEVSKAVSPNGPRAVWNSMSDGFVKKYGDLYKLKEITDYSLGGQPGAIWVFSLKRSGQPEIMRTDVGVQRNGRGYAVLCSSPVSELSDHIEVFGHVMQSFAWK